MDPSAFFTGTGVHVVAGKGGVGKTTLTAALAVAAASLGHEVLVLEIEGRGGLPALFGHGPLGHEETRLADRVHGRSLAADRALVDYLVDHGFGLLAGRMVDTGLVEVVVRGAPGMKDILLLGTIKQLERTANGRVILVDAPASGHTVSFLRAPSGLLDAVAEGPINSQAAEVLELLTDPARCQVLLATVPEETPVNELVETAYLLEDEIGVHLGPVLVNGVLPVRPLVATAAEASAAAGVVLDGATAAALDDAARFRRRRQTAQAEQLARLADLLPLPTLRVARRFGAGVAASDVPVLAAELLDGIGAL